MIYRVRRIGMGLYRAAAVICVLAVLQGCRFTGPGTVPAISDPPTHRYLPGKFVWHDLLTDNPEAAIRFYGSLFAWTFEAVPDTGHTLIRNGSRPIGGIVWVETEDSAPRRGQWLASLSVKDVDAAAEFVRTHGGLIHEAPQSVGHRGRMTIVSDPQNARLVLLRSHSGDPLDRPADYHDWLWNELWTLDKASAIEFYGLLAGYTADELTDSAGKAYDILRRDGRSRAGVAQLKNSRVTPAWLPYIRVKDPAIMVNRVIDLGGRVLMPPTPNFENGSIAIVADPDGAVFALQKWSE